MKSVLLDTNAFRRLYEKDQELLGEIELCERIYLTPIVMGELMAGYKRGTKEKQNLLWLKRFVDSSGVEVMEVTENTAQIYAKVVFDLGKIGKPIPTNDIWIAAQAIEMGVVLVSYDKHFKDIAGLRLWEV